MIRIQTKEKTRPEDSGKVLMLEDNSGAKTFLHATGTAAGYTHNPEPGGGVGGGGGALVLE